MPIYEFVCRECGSPFEKLLGMTKADQAQICPSCGSQETQRQLSAFAVSGNAQDMTPAARPASSPFT